MHVAANFPLSPERDFGNRLLLWIVLCRFRKSENISYIAARLRGLHLNPARPDPDLKPSIA
jgi:hypothetical protein